ncbi:GPP34 family phosphoprotein [Streptomyces sp. NBC_00887]|nr:GPP34 family phosphoprotein [Streptomyces sp. NBC_00887]WSY36269.1 GPP34 family phosphoprotein [Streptomyces sp. NBC_00887]
MVTMDVPTSTPVDQEDLSLVLAAAELIDLLKVRVVGLESRHIVPGPHGVPAEHFLEQAAATLQLTEPYELIGDWLWRRDRALARSYTEALETDKLAAWQRPAGHRFRRREFTLIDSPARREAAERWAAADHVLVALAEAVGIKRDDRPSSANVVDSSVATVLSALGGTLVRLKSAQREEHHRQGKFDDGWGLLE